VDAAAADGVVEGFESRLQPAFLYSKFQIPDLLTWGLEFGIWNWKVPVFHFLRGVSVSETGETTETSETAETNCVVLKKVDTIWR